MVASSSSNFIQGRYIVLNKEKYIGNINNIKLKSSWEYRFAKYCDNCSDIIKWGYETTRVPYVLLYENKPINKVYHVDFTILDRNNNIQLIEIKPYNQTMPPNINSRMTKSYRYKLEAYNMNMSKWKYARQYAENKGYLFKIITEIDIFNKQ